MTPATVSQGKLYVVATPIGNPDDITLRALATLGRVDLIAAEDTRKTRLLLSRHGIKAKLVSYHEHNEEERTVKLLEKLKAGFEIALVSDAGTPLVSDPGYRLVTGAIADRIPVIPVPGVSAAMAALSVAGLPTDTFRFVGFLPKKQGKRDEILTRLTQEPGTLIFYESPQRIERLLTEIGKTMGERDAVLCRELTKPYEEILRGTLSKIRQTLTRYSQLKGECILLVKGETEKETVCMAEVEAEIAAKLQKGEGGLSAIAKKIARKHGLPKDRIYAAALALKKGAPEAGPAKGPGR